MKANTWRKTLSILLTAALVLMNFATLGIANSPMTGAIHVTDSEGRAVQANHFNDKCEVYLNGGPSRPGAAGLPDGEYYVQITNPSGALTLGTSAGSENEKPISVTNGDFDDLYKVCEIVYSNGEPGYDDTDNNGGVYKIHVSQSSDFRPSATKTKTFKVSQQEPTPQLGDIIVYKFHDANENGEFDADEALLDGWEFTITNGSVNETKVTNSNGYIHFEGLDPSSPYTITEEERQGWETSTPNAGENVEVTAGEITEVWFGNYQLEQFGQEEGFLVIVKEVQVAENTNHPNDEFQFAIYTSEDGELGTLVELDEDIRISAGQQTEPITLPVGDYIVVELGMDENEDYSVLRNYQPVTIEDGQTSPVTFINIYQPVGVQPEYGSLIIEKVVSLNEVIIDDYDGEFDFEIEDSNGLIRKVSVEAGDTVTIDNLPLGSYTVREVNFDDEYYVVVENNKDANFTEGGQTIPLIFENAIRTGTLTIEKMVTGEVTEGEEFEFVILDENGEIYEDEIFLGAEESVSFELPVGTYTVEEIGFNEDIYEVEVNGQEGTDLEVSIELDQESPVTVTFNNIVITQGFTVTPPPAGITDKEGTLTISKFVTLGGEKIDDNTEFTFIIKSDGKRYETVTLTGGDSKSLQLPKGKYVVSEEEVDGYEVKKNHQEVKIKKDEESKIEFYNAVVLTTFVEQPEDALVGEEEEKKELPVTSGTDFLMMGLGMAMTTGGVLFRRRKRK
ncbi:MSCRAMM family protein [Dethiobacter alkaliphilus]|uniref:MSCRAMM family protein n=1 Tax=Dethiobacter alkaliphilus TaxID=427926 RepID=UPI002226BF96|nr:SpaA isopeptide-forming pilin-related protein [Dethiobacter alkaliphilus]MCW3489287.1 LPXTG cell wall anchor domain-containing protein [Dethiobacter alkaliphilus]